MNFPKLKYLINTKGLTAEQRNQLLAYDCIYRCREMMAKMDASQWVDQIKLTDLDNDIDANLTNLGSFIETEICKGNLALYFENFDTVKTEPIGLDLLK